MWEFILENSLKHNIKDEKLYSIDEGKDFDNKFRIFAVGNIKMAKEYYE